MNISFADFPHKLQIVRQLLDYFYKTANFVFRKNIIIIIIIIIIIMIYFKEFIYLF